MWYQNKMLLSYIMTESPEQPLNNMFLVVQIDEKYNTTILSILDTYEDAVSYLTRHLDYNYELSTTTKYYSAQKSKHLFEIYTRGYLWGKYLVSKFQIIEAKKTN